MAAENNIVGEVGLKVSPVDPGFDAQLKRIIDRLERNAQFKVGSDTAEAERAVSNLAGSIDNKLGGAWASAALQVGAFTAAINIAQGAANRLLGSFSGLFDQLAQARAGFSAILGTENAGNALLDDIREFARESPFVTQELVNYSQQLLGVGQSAESIVPLLRRTGDLISSVGGDTQNISRVLFTLTQIRSIGRLVGQDAIQLQSALIPITKLLADQLGVTTAEVKKLQEQGVITADQVFEAITSAGERVEGAMANATRNISGARSVLQDTIQIALQDSPELNRIFEDIVQGILSLANALSDPEVQSAIAGFFRGVGDLYEGLRPLIAALAETGGESALVGLRSFTVVLNVLADVLNAIPTPVLEVVAGTLATIAAVRAPLALINYVNQVQILAGGLLGRFTAQTTGAAAAQGQLALQLERTIRATLAANFANATGVGRLAAVGAAAAAAADKYKGLIGAATAFAGIQLQQQQNQGAQIAGSALTGAGIGFSLGGGYGAAAGAAIGAVVGVLNSAAKKAEEEAKRLKEHAVEVAAEFFREFDRQFANLGESGAAEALVAEAASIDNVVDNYESVINQYKAQKKELEEAIDPDNINIHNPQNDDFINSTRKQIRELNEFIDGAEDSRKRFQAELDAFTSDPKFADWSSSIQTSLATLSKNGIDELVRSMGEAGRNPFFVQLISGERLLDPENIETDFNVLTTALDNAGISLNDLVNLPYEELVNKLTQVIPAAAAVAQKALDSFTAAVKRAGELQKLDFGVLEGELQAVSAALDASQGVNDAFSSLFQFDKEGAVVGLNSSLEAVAAAGNSIVENATAQYNQILQSALANAVPEAEAVAQANAAANNVLSGQFDALRETLQLTDDEFRTLLETAGLWDFYVRGAAGSDAAAENFQEYANQLGISAERLAEIVKLQGDIDSLTQITVTADVAPAIVELEKINQILADPNNAMFVPDLISRRQQLEDIIAQGTSTIQPGSPNIAGLTPEEQLQLQQDASDRLEAALFEIGRTSSDDYVNYLKTRMSQEQELGEEWLELRREVVGIEEDIANAQRQAEEEAKRASEEAQREADRIAREQEQELNAWLSSVESATGSLESAIQGAADAIEAAAANWVSSIKERTQYEQAVSAQAATRNAQRQITDLTEVTSGLANLRARGVSDGVLQALGIDGITDVRQIRRLVGSSDTDLAALSAAVGERDRLAQTLAQSQEDARQKKNITEAIVDAAKTLGLDVSKEQAASISNQFTITAGTSAEDIALQILSVLTSGRISR